MEDFLDTSTCNVLEVSSDDEFNVVCLGTASSHDWPFNPIIESLREELYRLQSLDLVQLCNRRKCVQGKIPMRERIMGDGNYYFRCIPFILSGTEEFHPEVRKAICDFIEVFDADLSPFLMKGQGKKYRR